MISASKQTAARRGPPPNLSLLEGAIERNGLHPFFQGKFSMATGKVVGVEALARIAGPQQDLAPAPYVELAERTQRIDGLTLAMARTVARCVLDFNRVAPIQCAINISPMSLNRPEFARQVAMVINETGLECEQFTLEVTEASDAEYGPHARATMLALRQQGFGLAVDDFGAGTTSIDRLKDLPFTEVKIDAVFTKLAMSEAYARTGIVNCVKIAKELGLKVTAKGIETQQMWDFCKWLGVDEAQGFLLARPLPPHEFKGLIQQG
jgi:EAL domain-containing protein (putative c-di-GMP-specific phosphodiesterase class I)